MGSLLMGIPDQFQFLNEFEDTLGLENGFIQLDMSKKECKVTCIIKCMCHNILVFQWFSVNCVGQMVGKTCYQMGICGDGFYGLTTSLTLEDELFLKGTEIHFQYRQASRQIVMHFRANETIGY